MASLGAGSRSVGDRLVIDLSSVDYRCVIGRPTVGSMVGFRSAIDLQKFCYRSDIGLPPIEYGSVTGGDRSDVERLSLGIGRILIGYCRFSVGCGLFSVGYRSATGRTCVDYWSAIGRRSSRSHRLSVGFDPRSVVYPSVTIAHRLGIGEPSLRYDWLSVGYRAAIGRLQRATGWLLLGWRSAIGRHVWTTRRPRAKKCI